MDDHLKVKWAEAPMQSRDEAIYAFLTYVEEMVEEIGWDQAPALGVVSASELAGVYALSLEFPDMPREFAENFETEVPRLAASVFGAEVGGDVSQQEFLNQGVSPGYEGWLICAEFSVGIVDPVSDEPISDLMEHRLVMFVDIEANKYGVGRGRGESRSQPLDQLPSHMLVKSLALLNAASLMSLTRRKFADQ